MNWNQADPQLVSRPAASSLSSVFASRRRSHWQAGLMIAVCGLMQAPAGLAQTVTSEKPAAEEEVLTLSPFVVKSSGDVGFVATSSLAGGRLASDLKDTPAAYSVQTSEFLEALGIIDVSAAAEWTVNAASIEDNGSREIFGSPTQISIRGGTNASTVRDFFRFAARYDSYNLDRIDYARGPNAVLFGNGDYSGTINAVTRRAIIGQDRINVKLSYGSWDNQRVTIGVNRPLTDAVAVRVDALWQDRGGRQDFESEEKKAFTGNLTWKLSPRTELRFQGEVGEIERNNPLDTFNDNVSGWDGVTTFSGPVSNADNSVANQNAKGFARYGSATVPYFAYTNALGAVNLAQTARTIGGNLNANVSVGGQQVVGATANVSGLPIGEAINLPASRFDRAFAGSNFFLPNADFGLSTNNPTFAQKFQSFSAFLDHRVGERLFFQLSGNFSKERRWTEYMNSRGLTNVWIDINAKNPDGSDNPHFLDAYSQAPRERIQIGYNFADLRASGAYLIRDSALGDFSFNLSYQYSASTYRIQPWVYGVRYTADPRTWANSNLLQYRYYWGETNNPTPEIGSITYAGQTYAVDWTPNIAGSPSRSETALNTLQAAIKNTLFDERLHLLGAGRYDVYAGRAELSKLQSAYPTDWDAATFIYRPDAPANYADLTGAEQELYSPPDVETNEFTYTVGAVLHVTEKVSVYSNHSTTFDPNAARQLIDRSFARPQVASEWSGGVRYTLPRGVASVSLGYYQGEQENQVYSLGTTYSNNLNNIIEVPLPTGSTFTTNLFRTPDNFFDIRNSRNEGWELEVTANPTDSWRLSFNAAIPRAYQTNSAQKFTEYMRVNDSALRSLLAAATVNIDGSNFATTTNAAAANAAAGWNFLQTQLNNNISGDQLQADLNLYTANIFTDYRFKAGYLKGLRVGGGVNFRGKQVIGYRGADTIADPSNPANAIDDPNVDAYDTVKADAYELVTLTLGYQFQLKKGVRMDLSLVVSNALDYADPLYYRTTQRPNGGNLSSPSRVATPSLYRYLTPRSYNLTTSFNF